MSRVEAEPVFGIRLESFVVPLEPCMRNTKELLVASKAFTSETKWISWWHLLTAIACYLLCLIVASSDFFPMLVRVVSSCVSGLVIVRLFIIYHDYNHGAILKKSWIAASILKL